MALTRALARVEDERLLRGAATFAADVRFDDQLTMMVVRSPVAHGHLRDISTAEAIALPGIHAVLTAVDLRADLGNVPVIHPRLASDVTAVRPFLQPVIATDRVRYVGEPLAIVLADDRYIAEDAADIVFADIDTLDPVTDLAAATTAVSLFPEGNEVATLNVGFGDAGAAFAGAPVVVEAEMIVDRHTAVPMETRGLAVEFDPTDGRVRVYGSAKVLHWNRDELARQLDVAPELIALRQVDVGGSFGVRGEFYPEDFLAVWAARRLHRSVVWSEDRWENLIATNHARDQRHFAAIAGTADGQLLALRSEFWVDLGGYVRTNGMRVPELTATMLPGPYDLPSYSAVAHCVTTNRTPTGTYRAPGRAESTFVRERLLDMYSARVGLPPAEVRRRNLLTVSKLPFRRQLIENGPRVNLDSGDPAALVENVLARLNPDEVLERRARGECVGTGLGLFLELSAGGPPWESGAVSVDPEGTVSVRSGASTVGQGVQTALTKIVARELGVDPARVFAEMLDTERLSSGVGSFASRSTVMAGNAVALAARRLLDDARDLLAIKAAISPDEIEVIDGVLVPGGAPEQAITLGDAARLSMETRNRPLYAEETFRIEGPSSDFGAHAAVVRVDPETGAIDVERLVLGFDLGPAIDPLLVAGQLQGGALQALGGAVLERFSYDDDGNPLATSFMDYLLPTVSEAPKFETIVNEGARSPSNPLGLKGCGEGGTTGVIAAITNAICDALGQPDLVRRVPVRGEELIESIVGPPTTARSWAS